MNLLYGKDDSVIDRFSVGEMIYPTIFDREGELDWYEFYMTVSDIFATYVILYSSDENVLVNRINSRNEARDKEIDLKTLIRSNILFEFIGKSLKNKSNVLLFDISKTSSSEIIKVVEEKLLSV